jgi:hypothetical protein
MRILGKDNGLHLVEVDGEIKRLTDEELAELQDVKPKAKAKTEDK